MQPFRDQYLPTNAVNEDSKQSLRDRKNKGDSDGQAWLSKYLFHIPLKMASVYQVCMARAKTKAQELARKQMGLNTNPEDDDDAQLTH